MRVDVRPRKRNAPRPAWKVCPKCEREFARPARISDKQWEGRVHCGYACSRAVRVPDRLMRHRRIVEGPLDTPCWIWTGPTNHGYGRLIVNRNGVKQQWRAHRLSFAEFNKIDPGPFMVCHRCDTPLCINPKHLFLGTAQDNHDDMVSKGRRRSTSGEARSDSKLTTAAVHEIRSGGSAAALAEKYGVSKSAIYKARQGVSWATSND